MSRENLGTLWVCVDCYVHVAYGECARCYSIYGHDEKPLGCIDKWHIVELGMAHEDHHPICEVRIQGMYLDDYDCDCEFRTFSKSQCEGCGSYLHGERHAVTLFTNRT